MHPGYFGSEEHNYAHTTLSANALWNLDTGHMEGECL